MKRPAKKLLPERLLAKLKGDDILNTFVFGEQAENGSSGGKS